MKNILAALALSIVAVQCTSGSKNSNPTEITNPQQKTLKQLIAEGALLVDVRTPEEFESGSFPGAVNIPLEEVEGRVAEFKNDKGVIVFCRTGNRSGQAIKILNENGIKNTYNGINQDTLERELR